MFAWYQKVKDIKVRSRIDGVNVEVLSDNGDELCYEFMLKDIHFKVIAKDPKKEFTVDLDALNQDDETRRYTIYKKEGLFGFRAKEL